MPLRIASAQGHTSCVRALLKAGANVHRAGPDGRTALDAALPGCAAVLIAAGAKRKARPAPPPAAAPDPRELEAERLERTR
eukprot:scaffold16235_cov129-Isochrysis_galbana.AAC.3